ncbi:hypothetical protein C2G38_2177073 [Gigaspora rosea]|uniref:RING-type domain-containing protein n=1 Tax=Gigaspora rosea TaxID=44941 RepID=A0A397VHI1_9GLOM|nr:hypothetical protein C2G38_2177073 [Gigaspora rosea]
MCWNQCMAIPLWNLKDESTANENNLSWLRKEMVAKDFRLSSFFDSIYNASLPENRSSKYLDKLDKKLAVECYVICGNQNAKLIAFKKDISLFVDLMGVSTEAIDTLLYAMLNVDDYHNIHTKRTPDTCSTSSAAHMTTLLLNDSYYMGRMAKTFNDQLHYEVSLDEKLENMTLHKYDDHIKERKEERKMKDTILLDFFELSLKETDSYIIALQEVHKIPLLTNYLTDCVIPVVADWPGQVFTRQAITLRLLNLKDDIPSNILSFIPIISILHIQLNLLESILKTYWDFFNLEYQYIFSTSKMLSKTPSPYRIFILLELIRGAWKEIKPIVVAKVVDARKTLSGFEDVFIVQKKSTYANNDHLALLTKKAEVFLLETFGNVYQKLGQSSIIKGQNKKIICKLASLDFTADKKQMPLGFSSEHLPAYDKCDHCHKLLHDRTDKSSMVIACGHGYHESCFTISLNKKCLYCENKSNLKEFIDAEDDSTQNQKISDEDNILEVIRKDKQALPRVEQAYSMALERFLNI